jgi:perosamine synthetase
MPPEFIPYGRQRIEGADLRAVLRVLKSDYLTQGPEVARFEEAFAKKVGAPYAVAVSSGTAGLHLAWLAAGVGPGDEVVTSPVTFAATSNAVIYAGATPRFADIDPWTRNLDPTAVRKALTPRTRGVSPVHYAGLPAVTDRARLGLRAGTVVVEDGCHALGAMVRSGGRWTPVGACVNTEMTVFSFHPVKHITTGEGGMVTTRDPKLYERLIRLRTHGIVKDPALFKDRRQSKNPWYYEMQQLGFNYRLPDILCALGSSQLTRLDQWVERRRKIAAQYRKALDGIVHLQLPHEAKDTLPAYHLFAVEIDFKKAGITRGELMRRLAARGIGTQVHYIPVYRQPYYAERYRLRPDAFPASERFYERALSVPMHHSMTASDVRRVAAALKSELGRTRVA